MDNQVKALLDQLATTGATIALRLDDWEKLYTVCVHSHMHGGVPDLQTIKTYMVDKGCSKPTADSLGRQFEHLTAILQQREENVRKAAKR